MVELQARSFGDAPPYVVVRLEREPQGPEGHDHVTVVETRDPDGGSTRWRMADVIDAIRGGERFVLDDWPGGESILEPALCRACPRATVAVATSADQASNAESAPSA